MEGAINEGMESIISFFFLFFLTAVLSAGPNTLQFEHSATTISIPGITTITTITTVSAISVIAIIA